MTGTVKAKAQDRVKYGRRHTPGVMNQTESLYAEWLQALKTSGQIVDWQFEAVTFKLAKLCTYTPDFMVTHLDGILEFIDTKGGGPMDNKSRVKIKCAAEKFWQFKFAIEKRQAKKNGGGWTREDF